MKKHIFILSLIIFSIIKLYPENTVYEFGPKTEWAVVFTSSRDTNNNETFSTKLLHNFAEKLSGIKLSGTVIIAITDNDIPDLPETIPANGYKNINLLINKIYEKKTSAVFILSDGEENKVKIIPGSDKKTSPPWIIESLFEEFSKQNIKMDFNSNDVILKRLGFLENDKILAKYLNEGIPSVAISTNKDITSSLISLANKYSQEIPQDWDKHYNIKKIFKFIVIKERFLIIIMLAIMMFALFYIFMFSFLFGKKKEVHIKDLLTLWRVPILFFILNIISFYLSEYIVLFIFRMLFGNADAINLFPVAATVFKFALAFSISSGFLVINRKTNLPQNTFIYGYLASFSCFFNIFIFSSLDLSLSLMFLEIYALSFISYHLKRAYIQIIFFILNLGLLVLYFFPLFFHTDNFIPVLFYADNFAVSFFVTPYYLMLTRIFFRLKRHNPDVKFNKVTLHIFISLITVICFVLIIIGPDFLMQKQKRTFLLYKIENKINTQEVISGLKTMPPNENDKSFLEQFKSLNENDFIAADFKLENYLERSIGEIKVSPALKAALINILIIREDGFPIYEASSEFTTSSSGKEVSFLSPLNINEAFSIKFSGEKNSKLNIKINAWFYDSPLKIDFKDNAENKKLIFQVTKEFVLKPDSEI